MPDPTLHGNGTPCPVCNGTKLDRSRSVIGRWCRNCRAGRALRPIEEIIAEHVAEARQYHWPEFERRIRA